MIAVGLLSTASPVPCPTAVETLDASSPDILVCGAYGDPHIIREGKFMQHHMGQGEYQLISVPALSADVHYFGCGLRPDIAATSQFPKGTYMGALAVKIGSKQIEIVANDLSVVGGESYQVDWHNDKPLGPYTIHASATTITLERESILAGDLHRTQWEDTKHIEADKALYRWTISTTDGLIIHSHAVPSDAAQGGYVLDVHVNYPKGTQDKAKGLCIDMCTDESGAGIDCGASTSCMPINASATYGVSPIFTAATTSAMLGKCTYTQPDKTCAAVAPTGPQACKANGVSMHAALLACVHLSGLSDSCYHDACIFDLCQGGSAEPSEEWVEQHAPPANSACKVVADPHITSFSSYKYEFNGEGAYSLLSRSGATHEVPCDVDIQSFECSGGYGMTSYLSAVGITATGGTGKHELVFGPGKHCTIDGAKCKTAEGSNVGIDGVKLVPYTPSEEHSEHYGEYGVGVAAWYVYSNGYAINVTMAEAGDGTPIMNLMVSTPPMCTAQASGLCMVTAETADEKLQAFAEKWMMRKADMQAEGSKKRAKEVARNTKQQRQSLLAPGEDEKDIDVKDIDAYPPLKESATMAGLRGLTCPDRGQ